MTDTTTKTIQLVIAANPNATHAAIADKVISRLKLPLSHRSRIAQRVGRMRNKGKTQPYLANVVNGKDISVSHKLDFDLPRTSLDDWHEEEVRPSFFVELWRSFIGLFRRS